MTQQNFIIRERTPLEIILHAIYLYLNSLRQTSRTLTSLNINRSHEAIRLWIHKLATKSKELVLKERGHIAIVRGVNVGGVQYWLWIAIEPKCRAVLALMLTGTRNIMLAYSFLMSIRRRGVRSYVERFMGSVKDRLRGFDCYFPSPKRLVDSALKLVYAWVL